MRCSICGNENPETHRFCGACGTSLVTAPSRAIMPSVVPRNELDNPAETAPREHGRIDSSAARDETPTDESPAIHSPMISGPSFLGLNQPGSANGSRRNELGSFDYLLDDVDEERKGGKAKYLLIVAALLVACGLGYLRWKNQTQGWFNSSKPSTTEQTPDESNASTAAPSAEVAKNQNTATNVAQPVPAPSPAPGGAPSDAKPANAAPASGDALPAAASSDAASTPANANSVTGSATDQPDSARPTEEKKPAPARPAKAKPPPARPAETSNSVAEATRYIYGRGVTQDCDRGLRLLKPAANQADPRAMIQMGALYSAGLCTPHDLPTAYRWFALALRKEPDNISVQGDLQKLWSEMTGPERQLAIRLSQ